jgi:hypothetical protein
VGRASADPRERGRELRRVDRPQPACEVVAGSASNPITVWVRFPGPTGNGPKLLLPRVMSMIPLAGVGGSA